MHLCVHAHVCVCVCVLTDHSTIYQCEHSLGPKLLLRRSQAHDALLIKVVDLK